jgi:Uma2 family endonuclease
MWMQRPPVSFSSGKFGNPKRIGTAPPTNETSVLKLRDFKIRSQEMIEGVIDPRSPTCPESAPCGENLDIPKWKIKFNLCKKKTSKTGEVDRDHTLSLTIPMAQADSLAITVHDYMAMPEGPPYHELIEGDLVMSPSPNWRHQKISRNIERILERYLEVHDIGELFHAPLDVILNEINVYQPDVLFFRYSRGLLGEHGIEGAPDFVVEILSESNIRLDIKRKVYAKSGVNELWFIDPIAKQTIVYDLTKSADEPVATYNQTEKFTSPIFPDLTFDSVQIFRGI